MCESGGNTPVLTQEENPRVLTAPIIFIIFRDTLLFIKNQKFNIEIFFLIFVKCCIILIKSDHLFIY